ncbi:18157_t:CDS:2, partial [Racocetra persica]
MLTPKRKYFSSFSGNCGSPNKSNNIRTRPLSPTRNLNCVSPTKGDLLPWVKEGVFLLNTALTKAKRIGEECQIDSEYSLASAHPSPYSAEHGFFGSWQCLQQPSPKFPS